MVITITQIHFLLNKPGFLRAGHILYIYIFFKIYLKTAVIQKAYSLSTNDTWWWIKGDGCDVIKGIWESTKGEWSGDVDLNDNQLENIYSMFQKQLQWAERIGLNERSNLDSISCDLNTVMKDTVSDLDFVYTGTF